MLLIRTAIKNIISGGKKTWLNVFVLSFSMIILVGYNGLIDGWVDQARRESAKWEVAGGQFWHSGYDRYDIFTLQDAHGQIPPQLKTLIGQKQATPQLIMQGSIYPNGRMKNILVKGIEPEQTILDIPAANLRQQEENSYIPAIIGARMSNSTELRKGDIAMLRWRDKNGVFDAREIIIADVFANKVPGIDFGQIWISLDDLYKMTGMRGEATIVVISTDAPINDGATEDWVFRDVEYLNSDITQMENASQVETFIIFCLLIALCLLAVFDTQTLSIFRRQKEIGTLVALGMTPKRVMIQFTIEGTLYSVLGVVAGLIWGTPILWLLGERGFSFPSAYDNIMGVDKIYPTYIPSTIIVSMITIILLSALISYLPARKIAKQNIVYALKGKIS